MAARPQPLDAVCDAHPGLIWVRAVAVDQQHVTFLLNFCYTSRLYELALQPRMHAAYGLSSNSLYNLGRCLLSTQRPHTVSEMPMFSGVVVLLFLL
jgi:hypothetical protein